MSGGRPAGGRAHSPAGVGTAGEQLRSVPRTPSQAEPVWAAALAGARVARVVWVGMAAVVAVMAMAVAVMEMAGAVMAGVVRAGARVARVAVVAEVAGAVAKVAAMAARTKHR
jgi:hypothetical protein